MTGLPTVAVISTGDMGHAVGRVAVDRGCRVLTCLDGRSARTRTLAQSAGIEDGGSLAAIASAADIILSILPPADATGLARAFADTGVSGNGKTYVDCNAIAPATALEVGDIVTAAGYAFLDGGIIGPAPVEPPATRLYISGSAAQRLGSAEPRSPVS